MISWGLFPPYISLIYHCANQLRVEWKCLSKIGVPVFHKTYKTIKNTAVFLRCEGLKDRTYWCIILYWKFIFPLWPIYGILYYFTRYCISQILDKLNVAFLKWVPIMRITVKQKTTIDIKFSGPHFWVLDISVWLPPRKHMLHIGSIMPS